MKSIVLGGFMGCGKTTLAKLLSEKLHMQYTDTDDYVKELAGVSIHDMIEAGRLSDVRRFEKQCVYELASSKDLVIATGAGVMANEENGKAFHENCFVVFVDRDFDTVYPLISKDPVRSLAFGKSYEELKALSDSRIPTYRKYADLTVTNNGDPALCADAIIHAWLSTERPSAPLETDQPFPGP